MPAPALPHATPHRQMPHEKFRGAGVSGDLHLVDVEAKIHVGLKCTSASQRLCASGLGPSLLCASVSSTGQ